MRDSDIAILAIGTLIIGFLLGVIVTMGTTSIYNEVVLEDHHCAVMCGGKIISGGGNAVCVVQKCPSVMPEPTTPPISENFTTGSRAAKFSDCIMAKYTTTGGEVISGCAPGCPTSCGNCEYGAVPSYYPESYL